MVEIQGIDTRGFDRFREALGQALIGTGQDGALPHFTRTEASFLALEIAHEISPDRAKAEAKMTRDVKREFAPGPQTVFEAGKRKPQFGETNITWLYAGPAFLVGVQDDDLRPGMEAEAMRKQFADAHQANFPRGKAWVDLGNRGRQHVKRWNRTIVTREKFAAFTRMMAKRLGRQAATFDYAAFRLGRKNISPWFRRHFDEVSSDGAAIFRESGSGDHYLIEFGSRTPGVVSNPHIREKIQSAVNKRKAVMKGKVEKILAGFAYDWNTGRVFRKSRGEEMMRELEENERQFDEAA